MRIQRNITFKVWLEIERYAANEGEIMTPSDFDLLLVTEGHHYGQPISND
jgi:hypothetical protein